MFARRNSLTLGLIWLVLLVVGLFWYVKDTRRLEAAYREEKQAREELERSQNEIRRLTDVETLHEELKQKWLNEPKVILAADEPSFTLSYLNWIMSTNSLIIDFDFTLNGKREDKKHTEFTYTLNGEASYQDLHKLVWYLTYGPILYQIYDLNMRRQGADTDLLRFTMRLRGFTVTSQSDSLDDLHELRKPLTAKLGAHSDIFAPRIKPTPKVVVKAKPKPKLPPKRPGEIDVEKAKIRAITGNSVFISEGGSGLVELKVGDPVYLGKLVRIDLKNSRAIFRITKFGRSHEITLGIDQRN